MIRKLICVLDAILPVLLVLDQIMMIALIAMLGLYKSITLHAILSALQRIHIL